MGTKEVTYKHLRVGQKIEGVKTGGTYEGFTGYVDEINPAFVTVAMWRVDGRKVKYSTGHIFVVEMTEDEYRERWNKKAGEIVKALQNRMSLDEIGGHSMYNAWISTNLWEMAEACERKKLHLLGYCPDIPSRHSVSGYLLDIGFCVETEEGDRFWCHARSSNLETITRRYQRYQEWRKDHIGDIGFELQEIPYQIEEERVLREEARKKAAEKEKEHE